MLKPISAFSYSVSYFPFLLSIMFPLINSVNVWLGVCMIITSSTTNSIFPLRDREVYLGLLSLFMLIIYAIFLFIFYEGMIFNITVSSLIVSKLNSAFNLLLSFFY